MHISKLREENAANKANNKAINKIAEDFEKIVGVTKLKELKRYAKSITKLQKMKNTQPTIKPTKIGGQSGSTYSFGRKVFTHNFRPEKVKMTNKVFREKFHCVVC